MFLMFCSMNGKIRRSLLVRALNFVTPRHQPLISPRVALLTREFSVGGNIAIPPLSRLYYSCSDGLSFSGALPQRVGRCNTPMFHSSVPFQRLLLSTSSPAQCSVPPPVDSESPTSSSTSQSQTDVPSTSTETAQLTFEFSDGRRRTVAAQIGSNLLDVVIDNDVDIDGFGACEGTLACSTCHLILSQRLFDEMDEDVSAEELDMLDLAYGLQDTSRLGCQCVVTRQFDGETFIVPATTNDLRAE